MGVCRSLFSIFALATIAIVHTLDTAVRVMDEDGHIAGSHIGEECEGRFTEFPCQEQSSHDRHVLFYYNFKDWEEQEHGRRRLVCFCEKEARLQGYDYFSLSLWGICNGLKGEISKGANCDSTTITSCDFDSQTKCPKYFDETIYMTGTHALNHLDHGFYSNVSDAICKKDYKMFHCQSQAHASTNQQILFYYELDDWNNQKRIDKLVCLCRNEAKLKYFEYFSISSNGCYGMKLEEIPTNCDIGERCELYLDFQCAKNNSETIYQTSYSSILNEELICKRSFQMLECQGQEFENRKDLFFYKFKEWSGQHETLHRLVCLCNNEAKTKNYTYFSLSRDGICQGLGDKVEDGNTDQCTKRCDIDNTNDACQGEIFDETIYLTGTPEFEVTEGVPRISAGNESPSTQGLSCDDQNFQMIRCQVQEFSTRISLFFYKFEEWSGDQENLNKLICLCNNEAKSQNFDHFSLSKDGKNYDHLSQSKVGVCEGLNTTMAMENGSLCERDCLIDDITNACTGETFDKPIYRTGMAKFVVAHGG